MWLADGSDEDADKAREYAVYHALADAYDPDSDESMVLVAASDLAEALHAQDWRRAAEARIDLQLVVAGRMAA